MKKSIPLLIATPLLSLIMTATASAVTNGQIDTFEDGTTQNWVVSLINQTHPAPPVNVPSGGPAGVDDNYLQLTALGGGGPASRLSVINFLDQWAGNYITAGIGAIQMDVNNLGSSDLTLRLMFSDPLTGPPENIAFSDGVVVPAGSGWLPVEFPIGLSDLTAGLGSVEDALMNATEMRIYHSPDPNFPNPIFPIDPVVALLGVDNIAAVSQTAVPESVSAGLLLGLGLLSLVVVRRRVGSSVQT